MKVFQPPPFRSHRVFRGGHLQTIASVAWKHTFDLRTIRHLVDVSDGDRIVLHENRPQGWKPGDPSLLLIHGLCGCHAAPYMIRLALGFYNRGVRVYRVDMRGCGAGAELAEQLTHAGRSDDVVAALAKIDELTHEGPLHAIGVSLGGNQLLRAAGRIGGGIDTEPSWFERLKRIAAVSPPIDLHRCSKNMQRRLLRPYNRYFIKHLLARIPKQVAERDDFAQQMKLPRPQTLRELDQRITAPISGFANADEYYTKTSAHHVIGEIQVPTLILAAKDDPIVPAECFSSGDFADLMSVNILLSDTGGHVGFIDRNRQSWMDQVLYAWFDQ